jgi:hypothetical protein
MDVDLIRRQIDLDRTADDEYAKYVSSRVQKTRTIWYEDIFAPIYRATDSLGDQICDIIDFLGFAPPSRKTLACMALGLSPAFWKHNSPKTYSLIPNIDQIEARCGSDETGWLLSDRD